jgi:hypothetical protein
MRSWFACFVCFLLSAAISSETDPWQSSSEKLKHWRVKKLAGYDRPAIATPQSPASALGNRQERQDGCGTVPTYLSRVDSDAGTAGQAPAAWSRLT